MSQTLVEMATEAGKQIGDHAGSYLEVLKASVRRRYKQLLRRHTWPDLNRSIDLTVASGESSVGVPIKGVLVRSIWNVTCNHAIVNRDQETMNDHHGYQIGQSGSLDSYVNEGARGVSAQPGAATLLQVASSSASDVGDVRISGFYPNDTTTALVPFTASIALQGTTATTIASAASFSGYEIGKLTKEGDTVGYVTLTQASGATGTLGIIGPKERAAQYTWIRFNAAADQDTSIRVNCRLHNHDLVEDDDVPALREIEDILVEGACADGMRRLQQYAKAQIHEGAFRDAVEQYVFLRTEDGAPPQGSGTMHMYRETY